MLNSASTPNITHPRQRSLPPVPENGAKGVVPVNPKKEQELNEAKTNTAPKQINSPTQGSGGRTSPPPPASIARYQSALMNKRPLVRSQTETPKTSSPILTPSSSINGASPTPRDRPLPSTPGSEQLESQKMVRATGSGNASPSTPKVAQSHLTSAKNGSPRLSATSSQLESAAAKGGQLTASKLKVPSPEKVLEIIKEDPSVLQPLIAEVLSDAKRSFLNSPEILRQTRKKQEKEARLFLSLERESKEGKRRQIQRTMRLKHEKMEFRPWRHIDHSGSVFGFEFPIVLEIGIAYESQPNHITLCELMTNVDIADVSLLFRSSLLYQSLFPDATVVCCLLGDSFTEAATSAAAKTHITLVPIELPASVVGHHKKWY